MVQSHLTPVSFISTGGIPILTRIDHVMICVPDLQSDHPGGGLLEFLARGGGFRYVAVQSDDLVADVAQMQRRGVDVSDPRDGGRQTPTGQELRWQAATLGPRNPLPIFFIEHLTPLHERRRQASPAGTHPNGVLRVDRVYTAVASVAAAAETYSHVLGIPVPKVQRGAVIKADIWLT